MKQAEAFKQKAQLLRGQAVMFEFSNTTDDDCYSQNRVVSAKWNKASVEAEVYNEARADACTKCERNVSYEMIDLPVESCTQDQSNQGLYNF